LHHCGLEDSTLRVVQVSADVYFRILANLKANNNGN